MHISGDRKYYTAAKLLFISQPALSLYISNLENILGIRLFERIGKSFVLTQAGELYVEKARQMLSLKESLIMGFQKLLMDKMNVYAWGSRTFDLIFLRQ